MKIAVSGKGGAGKTTVAGTLARAFARKGWGVLAIDADSNPNLGVPLGIPRETAAKVPHVPGTVLTQGVGLRGAQGDSPAFRLGLPLSEVMDRYGARTPEGVGLLVMGGVDHAGTG